MTDEVIPVPRAVLEKLAKHVREIDNQANRINRGCSRDKDLLLRDLEFIARDSEAARSTLAALLSPNLIEKIGGLDV